jgi:hypothetical protein
MDPYLEGATWMNFHGQLCSEIARQLGPKLRPRYLARLTERFFTELTAAGETTKSSEFPDIAVVESKPVSRPNGTGGLGVATVPVRIPMEIPESILHFSVEIRDRLERRLVTSIEILSPTNKRGEGRDEYPAKRRRILHSRTHLIEIALLQSGRRIPMTRPLPPAPYYVYVGRFEIRPETDVWPILLDQPLPTIPVPLLPGDADVFLDLQLALTTVYDLSDYNLEIDYTQPPGGRLSPTEAAWVDERLRAAGLRP